MRRLLLLFLFPLLLNAQELPLSLGGYFSSVYEKSRSKERITLDDLAFIFSTHRHNTDLLLELEAKDLYFKQEEPIAMEECEAQFNIERLFIRHYLSATQMIKIGKFNTPVGFWNIIPINPLRDTISVVNLSIAYFPKLLTGILYQKENENFNYLLALQENPGIDDGYNNFKVKRHYLLTLTYHTTFTSKWSLGYYESKEALPAWYMAYGFQLQHERGTLTFESILQRNKEHTTYDFYIASLYHLYPHWAVALRIENFQANYRAASSNDTVGTTTLIFRPQTNIALKAECNYFFQTRDPQWLFSVSFMF